MGRSLLLWIPLLAVAPAALGDTGQFGDRPDAHAPIGVMGEHLHGAGEWMLSYRYTRVRMDSNRSRTDDQSVSRVLADFPVTPTDMDVDMHVWGLMFAPTDWLTVVGMLPYVSKEMDHTNRGGLRFRTRSHDLGDVRLSGLLKVFGNATHRVHLNGGLSFPTGSINETDRLPTGRARLPYPMQIGSGTWDLLPGVTYVGHTDAWSWGSQALGVVRTGRNEKGYRLGNRVELNAWLARPIAPWLSLSGRTSWQWWDDVHGADAALNPLMVPTADPDRRGGHRLELLAGLNLLLPLGPEGANRYSHRLAIEAGFPAYQWLDGPQLETDWRVTVGWQKAFGPWSVGPLW